MHNCTEYAQTKFGGGGGGGGGGNQWQFIYKSDAYKNKSAAMSTVCLTLLHTLIFHKNYASESSFLMCKMHL